MALKEKYKARHLPLRWRGDANARENHMEERGEKRKEDIVLDNHTIILSMKQKKNDEIDSVRHPFSDDKAMYIFFSIKIFDELL